MICPNCGSNISDKRNRCARCGTDLVLYKKILRASNQYYNIGLAKAKVRDLSGAIVALRNSVELNKYNTNARNLLGLIYFEMGETVAALSEWVISRHFNAEDNVAEEYINKVQSNPTKLDNLNQAIKRYNNALNFTKQGSDDLAIIQLKRAIQLNPRFIRAFQLLALLYMKGQELEKAKRYLIRAAKIDVSNTTTLRYMREMETQVEPLKDSNKNLEADKNTVPSIMPITTYREDKPNIMAFVNLVIGIILGVAVTAFLIVPTIKENQKDIDHSDYIDFSAGIAEIEEKNQTIVRLTSENENLQRQVEDLKEQINNFVIPEDKTVYYEPLFEFVSLFLDELDKSKSERDYLGMAEKLASIQENQLEVKTAVDLLTSLKDEVYPEASDLHYDQGRSFYNSAQYEEALVELEKAITYLPTNVDAIYFMGRAYHRLQENEKAITYYNIVVTQYPDSRRYSDAKKYMNQLQG